MMKAEVERMARVQSTMVALGTVAPAFELMDAVSGRAIGRDDVFAGDGGSAELGLLVMFVCVHCPFVKHVEAQLARLGEDYAGRIAMVAISANDAEAYPEDGPAGMKAQAERLGWRFAYLYDETQEVARAYDAACTPDFFLFDRGLRLVYRGQLDGSRPHRASGGGNDLPVDGVDLRRATDDVVAGRVPSTDQKNSLGCNIKWSGME